MAAQASTAEDPELSVRCVDEAYEALRLVPGPDANGPVLGWQAEEQFVQSHRRGEPRDSRLPTPHRR